VAGEAAGCGMIDVPFHDDPEFEAIVAEVKKRIEGE
jgi:hypothetical protein